MARRHIFVLKWPGSECLGFAELLRQFMDAESLVQVGDWDQLQAQRYDQDLILIEMKWGSGRLDGRESIRLLRQELEDTPIIALSETGSVGLAEQAVQAGATDFLVRSGDLQQRIKTMLAKVERTLKLLWENRQLNETQSQAVPLGPFPFLIGNSPLMNAMLEKIERVAKIPRPILIVGERGTGKELVARAIHQAPMPSNKFCWQSIVRLFRNLCWKVSCSVMNAALFRVPTDCVAVNLNWPMKGPFFWMK